MVINILGVTTTTCEHFEKFLIKLWTGAHPTQSKRAPTHLGGHWPAPAGLQSLELLLHHLEKVLHLLYFAAMTVLNSLYLRSCLI
jgi:hypothetical protein